MPTTARVRTLTSEEQAHLERLAASRTAAIRDVERARLILLNSSGMSISAIAKHLGRHPGRLGPWIRRFNAEGLAGLADRPRAGRPATHTTQQVALIIDTALRRPTALGLPFACWTLDRLVDYLHDQHQIGIQRSRLDELLLHEGLRWRQDESWFGARVDPDFAQKRGPSKPSIRRPRRIV
jgi:transposase